MSTALTKDARYWATYPLEVMARGHVLNDEEVRLMCACLSDAEARIADLEAARDEAVTALMSLERRATRVSDRGATTGPQWTQLTIGLLAVRSVLSKMPTPVDRAALSASEDRADG